MEIDLEKIGEALLVRPRFRRLDAAAAIEFRDKVGSHVEDRQLVVIAMGNVDFVDSSGLGCLISLFKRLPPGGAMRLAEASPAVERLLKLTRLDRVLPSFGSIQQAMA
jgi:anti-sigma B factor antagonist